MDETSVLLAILNSLKVLVSLEDIRTYQGTGNDRTLITTIECISVDFRALLPIII
jgi:hypothetical protein